MKYYIYTDEIYPVYYLDKDGNYSSSEQEVDLTDDEVDKVHKMWHHFRETQDMLESKYEKAKEAKEFAHWRKLRNEVDAKSTSFA